MTTTFNLKKTALAALVCVYTIVAWSNPTGPQIVNGQATTVTTGKLLTVTNTPGAVLNWQSFSIAADETTRFNQQTAQSSVLNRIVGQDHSKILGALQSNGKVFLINPNGIVFGAGSRVDVNALVASSLNLTTEDFLSGRHRFDGNAAAGDVINQGAINTASGGRVALIAPNVTNNGLISSPNGDVLLAAGHSVSLADPADPNLQVVISAPGNQALNVGSVLADAGNIGIYGALVRHQGLVSANSAVRGENGKIVFKATGDTLLEAGSITTATGAGTGGTIQALGNRVGLTGNAMVDASGSSGGGLVQIGGGYQGKDASASNATQSYVGPESTIKADATVSGDGGTVVVWADRNTQFYGNASARAAGQGNGGLIETSGKQTLDVRGARIDATGAGGGQSGRWLLDPDDVTIVAASATDTLTSGQFTASATSSILGSEVNSTLNAGTNVTIATATGSITVSDPINWTTAQMLTLNAGTGISIGSTVTNTGLGTLALVTSGGNITQTAAITGNKLVVQAPGGSVALNGANLVNQIAGSASGNFDFSNSQALIVGSVSTPTTGTVVGLSAGAISLAVGGNLTVNGDITSNLSGSDVGIALTSTNGSITLQAPISAGPVGVALNASGAITQSAGVIVGSNLNATAGTGIGHGSTIFTQVGSLSAVNSDVSTDISVTNLGPLAIYNVSQSDQSSTGGIWIDNAGEVTINGQISTNTGAIFIGAHSPLTVNGSVVSIGGGNITLIAGASGSVNDKLTVNSSAVVTTTGALLLSAGDAITLVNGSNVSPQRVLLPYQNWPTLDQCVVNPTLALCSNVLPTLSACTAAPTTPGCSVVLPTLSQCTSAPSTAGCSAVLPSLTTCTAAPTTAGCSAVLPSLAACTAMPTLPGCSVVLPSLSACIATPTLPGCTVILPTITACTATPTLPGCSVVLPSLSACIATPTLPGCAVILPTIAACTATPSLPGCSVVLPSLSACIATPTLPGCTVILPTIAACTATPTLQGCSVVLPSLNACIASPATSGCSAVLPSLAICTATPTLPGCSVVLPSLSACIATPTLPGCTVILPTLAQCTSTPTIAGCTAVLPSVGQCAADPTASGCQVVVPPTQTQTSQPISLAINSTINIINSTTPPLTTKPDSGTASETKKPDEKSNSVAAKDSGAKKDEPVRKLYCN